VAPASAPGSILGRGGEGNTVRTRRLQVRLYGSGLEAGVESMMGRARTGPGGGRPASFSERWRHARHTLGVSEGLVGEVGDVAIDGLGVDEAHGFLVAGLAEEALAGAEHDRVDLQP
jgi:hypothetical protein